jgi:hypothetical protein
MRIGSKSTEIMNAHVWFKKDRPQSSLPTTRMSKLGSPQPPYNFPTTSLQPELDKRLLKICKGTLMVMEGKHIRCGSDGVAITVWFARI